MSKYVSIEQTDPAALATLFDVASDDAPGWSDADRGPMLRHQLDQPLGESSGTYREALLQVNPDIERLRRMKDEAKAHLDDEVALPGDVATVLYYGALAAAHRAGSPITRLNHETLAEGLDWCTQQDWVPGELNALFGEVRQQLAAI